jgi:hypothetical protein
MADSLDVMERKAQAYAQWLFNNPGATVYFYRNPTRIDTLREKLIRDYYTGIAGHDLPHTRVQYVYRERY